MAERPAPGGLPAAALGAETRQDLVERALAASTSADAIVLVTDLTHADLRWANNTLTTNGSRHGVNLSVVAVSSSGGVGTVAGTASTRAQVEEMMAAADAEAAAADPAPDQAPLVGPDDVAGAPDLDRWEEPPEPTGIGVFVDVAAALGEAFDRAHADRRLLYGFVSHEQSTTYLGSSTGLRRRHVQPTGHIGVTAKDARLTRSAWVGQATRDFSDVDVAAIEADLARRLGWAERRVDLPAGRYDTILPPSAVADLMIDAYWSSGARVAHDGQSVWSRRGGGTRVGERVVRPGVRLFSDPLHPGLECSPFVASPVSGEASSVFDNGLPLGRSEWISDGTLTSLMQTRHTADLTGLPLTPAVDNLVLEVDGATGDPLDLVADVERGLLLTCLWYIRVVEEQTLLLTGLTRDGVYLVEDGEVVGAVNNFRFNESPVDLLGRFTAASATVPAFPREWGDDYFSRTAMPALRVPDFHCSSVSRAL